MTWLNSLSALFSEKVVYRSSSKFNPVLEVISRGNHLQLDTLHVNYSFGELHKSFQQLFTKMDMGKARPENVLILGFGAGSVASILLHEYKLNCTITGVEIDPEMITLGRRFFAMDALAGLTIIEENAFLYMKTNRDKFDLVIVDLYLDMDVPVQAETQEFALRLKDALTADGQLVFNKFVYDDATGEGAVLLGDMLKEVFGQVKLYQTGHHQMTRMFVCKSEK